LSFSSARCCCCCRCCCRRRCGEFLRRRAPPPSSCDDGRSFGRMFPFADDDGRASLASAEEDAGRMMPPSSPWRAAARADATNIRAIPNLEYGNMPPLWHPVDSSTPSPPCCPQFVGDGRRCRRRLLRRVRIAPSSSTSSSVKPRRLPGPPQPGDNCISPSLLDLDESSSIIIISLRRFAVSANLGSLATISEKMCCPSFARSEEL